jgi:hypothetical protein
MSEVSRYAVVHHLGVLEDAIRAVVEGDRPARGE